MWTLILEFVVVTSIGVAILLSVIALGFLMSESWRIEAEASILSQLAEGPKTGLDLVRDGGGTLRRGSVHGYLSSLEIQRAIQSETAPIPAKFQGQQLDHRQIRAQIQQRIYSLSSETDP